MQLSDLIEKFRHTRDGQGRAIFSTIFIAGNRLQTSFDRADGQVTMKQFMLLTMLRQSGEDMTFTQLGELLAAPGRTSKSWLPPWRRRAGHHLQKSPRREGLRHQPHREAGSLLPAGQRRFTPKS